jgi:hypothetical protein
MAAAVGHEQAETAMALFECALRALRQERDMPALVARLDTAMHERIQTLREQRAADDRRRLQSARRAPIQLDPDAKP